MHANIFAHFPHHCLTKDSCTIFSALSGETDGHLKSETELIFTPAL